MFDGITLKQLLMYEIDYNSIVIASNRYEKSELTFAEVDFKHT
ncbi:hypothetical protein [Macrococcus armenti]|nr:hypothetical protein [Macrococcus armenti]